MGCIETGLETSMDIIIIIISCMLLESDLNPVFCLPLQ